MFWSKTVNLFLFISFVNSQSNWYNKINVVKNGKNYINIYAFSEMEFRMETSEAQNFNFTIRKADSDVIRIKIIFSTASSSNNVICDVFKKRWNCLTSTEPVLQVSSIKPISSDQFVNLYSGYNDEHLAFLKEGQKYVLKISSTFAPADDQNLCHFLMEWPSSVTLHDKHNTAEEKDVPINFEICEESEKCDGLKKENGGVKFVRKGTLEFTMALLNKEKEYNILHSSGLNSPIFTIHASTFCSEYTTKFTFINLGSILFKKDSGKMDIETEFKPILQNVRNISIANDSDVNFYFYKNFVYCNFFDPQNKFQMRTLKLPEDMLQNQENSTNIQIDYKSTVKECNETLKLIVGNGVKLLFPKTDSITSTIEPSNFTVAENSTKEKDDKTETASFPLGAIIAISCIGGILLLGCLALIIYCGIKKYKKRKNAKTLTKKTSEILLSISEMEKKMLSKKKPKKKSKKKNKNPDKKTEEEFSIVYGKPTESFAPINVNVNGENEKVEQQKTSEQKNADEKIDKQKSFREKIEKMKKKYGAQQNQEEKNTMEDGEEANKDGKKPKRITKSKTKTETIDEGGATQTTQNSVQASKNSASEDSKPPNKKAKTKTRDGTAPTQASVTAENPES